MTTVLARTSLAGSNTGGIRETQDNPGVLRCSKHKTADHKIPMGGINDAWSRVVAKA